MSKDINEIEEKSGYKFKNIKLLETALTHSSYANQHLVESNERMEFLGDAVLNYTVAIEIFKRNPEMNEQFLTESKAAYVNRNFLHEIGKNLMLEKKLKQIGLKNPRLDPVVEALIGAIYLDGGFHAARRFIKKFILTKQTGPLQDYKGLLKTTVAEKFNKPIIYKIEKTEGPPHRKIFIISAKIKGMPIKTTARGKTKKEAELKASRMLLEKIRAYELFF